MSNLTSKFVDNAPIGVHHDSGAGVPGLRLVVDQRGSRWLLRYTSPATGKRRDLGLGSTSRVGLAAARKAARAAHDLVAEGVDPIDHKRSRRARPVEPVVPTFRALAEKYQDLKRQKWTRAHTDVWMSSMERHAAELMAMRIDQVDVAAVENAIRTSWSSNNKTAKAVLNRVGVVLRYAASLGHRSPDNPADVKIIGMLLPDVDEPTEHRAAVEISAAPAVYAALCDDASMAAAAVRWAMLTGVRSAEAAGARLSEIDRDRRVWTVPGERTKTHRDHDVPLTAEMVAFLDGMVSTGGDLIFGTDAKSKAPHRTTMLAALRRAGCTATVHGFRSTLRDFLAESGCPFELAEGVLAHNVGNQVSRAYHRSSLVEQRRPWMQKWTAHLCGNQGGTQDAAGVRLGRVRRVGVAV